MIGFIAVAESICLSRFLLGSPWFLTLGYSLLFTNYCSMNSFSLSLLCLKPFSLFFLYTLKKKNMKSNEKRKRNKILQFFFLLNKKLNTVWRFENRVWNQKEKKFERTTTTTLERCSIQRGKLKNNCKKEERICRQRGSI